MDKQSNPPTVADLLLVARILFYTNASKAICRYLAAVGGLQFRNTSVLLAREGNRGIGLEDSVALLSARCCVPHLTLRDRE